MLDLDQPATYSQWDPSGLGARLRRLPEQCRAGWLQGEAVAPPGDWDPGEVDKIVVCGMGGSAIAGNLVSDLIGASSTASRTTRLSDTGGPGYGVSLFLRPPEPSDSLQSLGKHR